ncbi:MAG TPA: helix-turn-helix domain-containing protein, partial [Isosphaeraceae bacterium]|nr:helix-turn-helix domain-containing protein [Isosphaeraceae bacterium]
QSLEEIEKHYILETLKRCNGNREEAARQLGIGERTLYRKLKEYNLGLDASAAGWSVESGRISIYERKIRLYNAWVVKPRRSTRWESSAS